MITLKIYLRRFLNCGLDVIAICEGNGGGGPEERHSGHEGFYASEREMMGQDVRTAST